MNRKPEIIAVHRVMQFRAYDSSIHESVTIEAESFEQAEQEARKRFGDLAVVRYLKTVTVTRKRRKPLRKMSAMERKRRANWTRLLHQKAEKKFGKCFVCKIAHAVHGHHILSQARGGQDTENNLLPVCLRCHEIIHANPEWATKHGYLISGHKAVA